MGSGRDQCVDKRLRPLGPYLCSPVSPPDRPRRRPDLGGREPVPVLQADQIVRAARSRLRGGARRSRDAAAGRHHLAHRAPPQRSRLQGSVASRTSARRRPASAISRAGSAGRRRPSARPATTATVARAATRRCASASIPGAARRKTTSCRTPTPSRSASRPSSSPASPATASGAGSRARPAARSRARSLPARTSSPSRACRIRSTVPIPASRSRSSCRTAASSPSRRSWSRTSSSSRSAIPSRRARAIPTGRCSSARRARWSTTRLCVRQDVAARARPRRAGFGLAAADDQYNPKVLPRRFMEDEAAGRFNTLDSPEFAAAFEKASARWLSRDCHRSQYGYPFRVAIQLALENRHRSVTLASFTCSGAEVVEGLFGELDPREGSEKVRAQFDQLSDLLCRGAAHAERELHAAGVLARQHADHGAAVHQVLVPAAAAQAADRRGADVDRRQRCRLRPARRLCADRSRRRPRADRRPGRPQSCASARRSRASISTCSTSA